MSAPKQDPVAAKPHLSWLKSTITVLALVALFFGTTTHLQIAPSDLVSGENWSYMADLFIRLGPFYRVASCSDAETAWGNDEPVSGKSNPAKVKAVCEDEETLYLYRPEMLQDQIGFLKQVWDPLMDTFRMAILGAFWGALLAIPFALLASRNLVKVKVVYHVTRIILNLIRTVPDMVWAALTTGAFGLGALPGVLALAAFSFGLNAKLLSESIETIDPGPLEAMQACGANRFQLIRYGVVPQVMPQFLAYAMYVLEIDVRASTVLGLVGAGGIGVLFNTELTFRRYPHVGAIVIVMLIVVALLDFISTKVRERLV